jgi:hypothetical protein
MYYVLGENVPDVPECFTPAGHDADDPLVDCEWRSPDDVPVAYTCDQCSGRHRHHWVSCRWPNDVTVRIGIPVRCEHCGARKCDMAGCTERRHHQSPHIRFDGRLIPVGTTTVGQIFDQDDF